MGHPRRPDTLERRQADCVWPGAPVTDGPRLSKTGQGSNDCHQEEARWDPEGALGVPRAQSGEPALC